MIGGLEGEGARIEVLSHKVMKDNANAVTVRYRVQAAGPHWLACQFSDDQTVKGLPRLIAATSDRWGDISQVRLFLLQRFWLQEDQNE